MHVSKLARVLPGKRTQVNGNSFLTTFRFVKPLPRSRTTTPHILYTILQSGRLLRLTEPLG
jgi:hypothetical protein